MPGEHLTTGFFGKVPAAGDFVQRGLPPDFVSDWDRWVARHLARPLAVEPLEAHPILRFLIGPVAGGPLAGVVMASTDSAGRCFPLTIAARVPTASMSIAEAAADWYREIEEAGDAARCGELDVVGLERRLAGLPFPDALSEGEPVDGMVFWTSGLALREVDPEAPADALSGLIGGAREAA